MAFNVVKHDARNWFGLEVKQAVFFGETTFWDRDGGVGGDESDCVGLVLNTLPHLVRMEDLAARWAEVFVFEQPPFDEGVFSYNEGAIK